jgi:hypothetical protein
LSYELCWRYRPTPDWLLPVTAPSIQHGLWIPSDSSFTVTSGMMALLQDLMLEREMLSFGDPPAQPVPISFGISNPPYPGLTDFAQQPGPLLESYEEA